MPARPKVPARLWHSPAADLTVTIVAVVIVLVGTLLSGGDGDGDRPQILSWALVCGASGALFVRRRYPAPVAIVTFVACTTYYPLGEPDGPILVTLAVALYTAAAEGRLLVAVVVGALAALAGPAGGLVTDVNYLEPGELLLVAGWLLAAVALGGVSHNRLAYLREADQRAVAAEGGAEAEAQRRSAEERLRMAREVHDIVGHNVSLISVQASSALHRIRKEPDQAEAALEAIKQASKETLRELRSTLGVLREADESASTAPAPSLSRLDDLVGPARATGLTVRTEVDGAPRTVPAQVDLAAYRIVQEALTNVTRHAEATVVTVRIRYADDHVRVWVDDNGTAEPTRSGWDAEAGSGIQGMYERVRALGGELTTGRQDGGGFGVHARLPIGGAA